MTGFDFEEVTTTEPEKSLLRPIKKSGGRNSNGRITSRHRGGGHKRRYRLIDFRRMKDGIPGRIATVEYDPNRSARIALLVYADGEKAYIVAPRARRSVTPWFRDRSRTSSPATRCLSTRFPSERRCTRSRSSPAPAARWPAAPDAARSWSPRKATTRCSAFLRASFANVRRECRATIGQVGNAQHENITLGKAGRMRWKGVRPQTRGIAMNPVDHPHGGGEGRAKGNHPQTPWGKPTKGARTRHNPRTDKYIVTRRKKK